MYDGYIFTQMPYDELPLLFELSSEMNVPNLLYIAVIYTTVFTSMGEIIHHKIELNQLNLII